MDQRRGELELANPTDGGQICVRSLGNDCQCAWCRGVIPRLEEAEAGEEAGE